MPDDGDDFGDVESESEDETETSGDGDGDGDGDEGESDSGPIPCEIVVTNLTITDDTPPESVACIEEVTGNLSIGPTTKLVDLTMLSNLRTVGDTMYVFGNGALTDLHGLEMVISVEHLHVRRNHKLVDLHGLDSLAEVDGISVVNNEGLLSVDGLPPGLAPDFVEIEDNDLLTNLDGLPLFESPAMNAAIRVEVQGNPTLVDLGGLSDCCAMQAATLHIAGNASLTNLTGLEGFVRLEALHLHDNFALASLSGIGNLLEVDTLDVKYDHCTSNVPSLVDLTGALNLSSIEILQIQWVSSLTSLTGLEQIPELEKLLVRNNEMLPWLEVSTLITQTNPGMVDACGGIDGPECSTEPCAMF
jgi:hypothetical protein